MGCGGSKSVDSVAEPKTQPNAATGGADGSPQLDSRLPFTNYKEIFTLKNYWKTIRRNEADCGKNMFYEFLKANPGTKAKYAKLKNAPDDITAQCSDAGFEALSAEYLKIFDDVITVLEEQPENCSDAITRLNSVGKSNSSKIEFAADDFEKMEEPFVKMISDVLQDRFNEKAESLFRRFYKFCLTHLNEGFKA